MESVQGQEGQHRRVGVSVRDVETLTETRHQGASDKEHPQESDHAGQDPPPWGPRPDRTPHLRRPPPHLRHLARRRHPRFHHPAQEVRLTGRLLARAQTRTLPFTINHHLPARYRQAVPPGALARGGVCDGRGQVEAGGDELCAGAERGGWAAG